MPIKPILLASTLLFSAALALGAGSRPEYKKELSHSFAVHPGEDLVLDAALGSVLVSTGVTDKVEVTVQLRVQADTQAQADEIFQAHRVDFKQRATTSEIASQYDSQGFFRRRRGSFNVTYLVQVPSSFNLRLKSGSGRITVPDLTGSVTLHTGAGSLETGTIQGLLSAFSGSGSIHLAGATSNVVAETRAGSIRLGTLSGAAQAKSGSGSITVEKAGGPLSARTSAGSIRVETAGDSLDLYSGSGSLHVGSAQGRVKAITRAGSIELNQCRHSVEAESGSGSLKVGLAGPLQDQSRLDTRSGSITLFCLPTLAAEVRAKTRSGRVQAESSLPFSIPGKTGEWHGKLNEGGPELELHSGSGSIQFQPLSSR